MAWAEQCKVAFEMTVIAKQHTQEKKRSINSILQELSKESGIPRKTLSTWWYKAQEEKLLKTKQKEATDSNNKEKEAPITLPPAVLPMCKQCGKKKVYTDAGNPLGPNSKYHGLCATCRRDNFVKIKQNKDVTTGPNVVCPKCGNRFFIKKGV